MFFLACATPPSITAAFLDGFSPQWQPLEQGVDFLEGFTSKPKLRFWALRVDTADPSLEIRITPKEAVDGVFQNNSMPATFVSSFVKQYNCIAGINTVPFDPVSAREGEKRIIIGLTVSSGVVVSAPAPGYDALVFYDDGSLSIENQAAISNPDSIRNASGGFYAILKDNTLTGHALSEQGGKRHPRSAAGIAGAALYLLVIDGRQAASIGATEAETALILQTLGAVDAINFDGGGSTALALRDKNGGVSVVNTPVHRYIRGKERAVATCLGIKKTAE
jgi:exopolysaccharide biosynthesis protein